MSLTNSNNFLLIPIFIVLKDKKNYMYSTSHSNSRHLILQIVPDAKANLMQVNGLTAPLSFAQIFIPKLSPNYLQCPLDYFQENVSFNGGWIKDSPVSHIKLDYIGNLEEVIIIENRNGNEVKLALPHSFGRRLLNYFKLDVCHNPMLFKGFDCYAFVSMIADVKYFKQNPAFDYIEGEPTNGDFVVLAQNASIPQSITHWALYLGNGYYLSKFGMSGMGTQSLVSVMNLKGMQILYESEYVYIARPKKSAEPWNGYPNASV